jgi:hypothetical protein
MSSIPVPPGKVAPVSLVCPTSPSKAESRRTVVVDKPEFKMVTPAKVATSEKVYCIIHKGKFRIWPFLSATKMKKCHSMLIDIEGPNNQIISREFDNKEEADTFMELLAKLNSVEYKTTAKRNKKNRFEECNIARNSINLTPSDSPQANHDSTNLSTGKGGGKVGSSLSSKSVADDTAVPELNPNIGNNPRSNDSKHDDDDDLVDFVILDPKPAAVIVKLEPGVSTKEKLIQEALFKAKAQNFVI